MEMNTAIRTYFCLRHPLPRSSRAVRPNARISKADRFSDSLSTAVRFCPEELLTAWGLETRLGFILKKYIVEGVVMGEVIDWIEVNIGYFRQ